jgi:hypothetical protein
MRTGSLTGDGEGGISPIQYALRTGDVAGAWERFAKEMRRAIRVGHEPAAKSLAALCYENLATLLRLKRYQATRSLP